MDDVHSVVIENTDRDNGEQVICLFNEFLDARLNAELAPATRRLQAVLAFLGHASFDSLRTGQHVVARINAQLVRLGYRLRCPKCGQPALLRFRAVPRAKVGSYTFDHRIGGHRRSHGGLTTFPPSLVLIPAAPDQRCNFPSPPQAII